MSLIYEHSMSANESQTSPINEQSLQSDLLKIMVVDDEYGIRRLLQKRLIREGFAVVTAANGRDALEELQINTPQVVLSDIQMPEVNGLQLLHSIRDQFQQKIKVILMTGYADKSLLSMSASADAILNKPLDFQELLQVLRG